jgi:hypothetical protein
MSIKNGYIMSSAIEAIALVGSARKDLFDPVVTDEAGREIESRRRSREEPRPRRNAGVDAPDVGLDDLKK